MEVAPSISGWLKMGLRLLSRSTWGVVRFSGRWDGWVLVQAGLVTDFSCNIFGTTLASALFKGGVLFVRDNSLMVGYWPTASCAFLLFSSFGSSRSELLALMHSSGELPNLLLGAS